MRKLALLFFLLSLSLAYCQTARDFLISDNDKIHFNSSITEVISESKNYGYSLFRNDKGEFVFKNQMSKFIILEKTIGSQYDEGFPLWSNGAIFKKYFFIGDDLNKESIWKIETEMYLKQYDNLSVSQINNCYKKIKNDLLQNYLTAEHKLIETTRKLNFKGILGEYYDIGEEFFFSKPSPKNPDYLRESIFTIGTRIENKDNSYFLTFCIKEKGTSKLIDGINDLVTTSEKSFDNIRFTIGDQDMRKINEYDLEAMVKFFLEDCKKSNKRVPELNTLKATFEPLQGNLIALSYALGDDSSIIIKVDPNKWANASIEKKWYVLYHELGHDVLNLEHGQGGKMMFNFADKEYSWDDFFKDKEYMLSFNKN
jgi:hypothetical protein